MTKHEHTEKRSGEMQKTSLSGSANGMLRYDARRIEAEKNTMKKLDEKRESDLDSRDVIQLKTMTTEMIAFQPKTRSSVAESRAANHSASYLKSDVEKNIDEAERYINSIATQTSVQKIPSVLEKTQKPLPSTMEITAFEPRLPFKEGESTQQTSAFTSQSRATDPVSADTAKTRAFRIAGENNDANEQTKAFMIGSSMQPTQLYGIGGITGQPRSYQMNGGITEQTKAFRVKGDMTEQTKAFRAGSAEPEQTKAFGVQRDATRQTRAFESLSETDLQDTSDMETPAETKKASAKKVRKEKELSIRYEYTTPMQNEKIEKDMRSYYKKVKLRLGFAVLLSVMLFLLENIAPVKALFPNRFAYITADWTLTFICMMLICDRLSNAFKSFFRRIPQVDCITILTFFFSVAATAVALVFEDTENMIALYNFPFAVCVFLNLLSVFYRLRRDIYSFSILSAPADKQAVVLGSSEDERLSDAEYSISAESTDNVKFGSIRTVEFIDGYFSHGVEAPTAQRSLKIFIPICLAASVAFFFCSRMIMLYSIPESIGVAYATFMMCAPFSAFLNYCYPLYLASHRAKTYNSAILCDKTPDMYRDSSMVVFRDTEAIPSGKAKVKSIRLYGDKKIDHAIYYASAVYSVIGGPLEEVFRSAALNSVNTENVRILEISNEGVCAMVGNKNIVIGRPSYMEEQCFETMSEPGDDEYDGNTNKRILYLACDQFIIAKFYIQYSVSTDFLYIANRLFSAGMSISVRTADPCLDDGIFYENKIDPEQNAIRISRSCLQEKEETNVHARRAGIVSVGGVKDLIKALLLCNKLENVRRTNIVLNTIASIFAVAVMALVIFTDNALGMYSVFPALYQLFWILPTYFVSKVYL